RRLVLDGDTKGGHRALEHDELQPPAKHERGKLEKELAQDEDQLRGDVQRGQRQVFGGEIPQGNAAKRRAPRREEAAAALAQGLQRAARPAIALLEQLERALRRLGEDDGARLVDDVPAGREQLHGEIEVLGEGVALVTVHRRERGLPEGAEWTRHDGHDAGEALRALVETIAGDVLEGLQRRPRGAAVRHAHVAGYGADARVGEMRDAVLQRIAVQDAVAVDAHHDLAAGVRDAVIQRVELAAVRLRKHAALDLWAAPLKRKRAHERLVGR